MTYWVIRIHKNVIYASSDRRPTVDQTAYAELAGGPHLLEHSESRSSPRSSSPRSQKSWWNMDVVKDEERGELIEEARAYEDKPAPVEVGGTTAAVFGVCSYDVAPDPPAQIRSAAAGTSLPAVGLLGATNEVSLPQLRQLQQHGAELPLAAHITNNRSTSNRNKNLVCLCAGDLFVHCLSNQRKTEQTYHRFATDLLLQKVVDNAITFSKDACEFVQTVVLFLTNECKFIRLVIGCGFVDTSGTHTLAFWDSAKGIIEKHTEYVNMFGSSSPLILETTATDPQEANVREINRVHGVDVNSGGHTEAFVDLHGFRAPRDGLHTII
jgi:hypothetical protein